MKDLACNVFSGLLLIYLEKVTEVEQVEAFMQKIEPKLGGHSTTFTSGCTLSQDFNQHQKIELGVGTPMLSQLLSRCTLSPD